MKDNEDYREDEISEDTLKMIESSIENMKKGKVSGPIDIDKINEVLENY